MKILFVIPVHNEEGTLEALTQGITEAMGERDYRILFVDDGSTDDSYAVLKKLREEYDTIDLIHFRGNFGKTQAYAIAFKRAKGDVLITMDADLQDDPEELPRFLEALESGDDLIVGWKQKRHDPWHKVFPSRVFNGFLSKIFNLKLHDVNCGFKAMRMEVAKNLPMYGDMHRMIPILAAAMGYHVSEIPVTHHPRRFGQSKYGIERYVRGIIDAATVWFLVRHRDAPAHLFGKAGLYMAVLGNIIGLGALAALIIGGIVSELSMAMLFALLGLFIFGGIGFAVGALLICTGLMAELIVRRAPATDTERFIGEEFVE